MKFKRVVLFADKMAILASYIATGFKNICHEFAYNITITCRSNISLSVSVSSSIKITTKCNDI